jgi:hypothetical protein
VSSKQASLSKLKSARDSFWFSLGAYALLTREPAASQVAGYDISVTNSDLLVGPRDAQDSGHLGMSYRIGFNSSLPNTAALAVVQSTFYAMLSDSYEACKAAAPVGIKDQDWYHFSRHLRNAISHNGRWHFQNNASLPATWRRMTVESSMHGHEIDGFIGWFDGLQLGATMQLFVSGLPDEA